MNRQIKLQRLLCFVSSMNAGGAETFLMKLYRVIDKTKYQFDFLVSIKDKGFYDDEIIKLGGKILYTPPKSKHPISNLITSYKIAKKGNYTAALRMTSHSLGTIDLLIAKLAGIKTLILRSTNAGSTDGKLSLFLNNVFSLLPKIVPTIKIAPSELAGDYLFGKDSVRNGDVQILKNAIPLNAFKFSLDKRNKKRKELGLEDNFVIGHVGRFNVQKNHKFLLNVFAQYSLINHQAKLLLIGTGELEEEMHELAQSLGIAEKTIFAGIRKDVPELLMAIDVLAFPSLFEGMPNVVIEAQATGLPCLISSTITKEAVLNDNVKQLDIEQESIWVETLQHISTSRNRELCCKLVEDAGYDINKVCAKFVKIAFGE